MRGLQPYSLDGVRKLKKKEQQQQQQKNKNYVMSDSFMC